jgi:RNA polymerase-binding transcription factor DksA
VKKRKEFLEKIKQKLMERQVSLSQELEDLSKDKVSDDQVMDSGDEALTLSMEKVQTSLQQAEIEELKLLEQSLVHLEKGEYGICMDCGEHISEARIEYYPYAARCIVCQEAAEER